VDSWYENEIRIRRDRALDEARRRRLARLSASGRSTRVRVADGVQALSDAFAALARSLRNGETA